MGEAARTALEAAGIRVVAVREVVPQRQRHDVPGQLGALTGRMAAAGVNVAVQYCGHDNQLVLVVDDPTPPDASHASGRARRAEDERRPHVEAVDQTGYGNRPAFWRSVGVVGVPSGGRDVAMARALLQDAHRDAPSGYLGSEGVSQVMEPTGLVEPGAAQRVAHATPRRS